MRLLLAGGAGTLGTDIVEHLHNEHEILVIDDFKESAEPEEWFTQKCKVIKCNLSERASFAREVIDWQPNCIIYLATTVSQDAMRGYESVEGIKNLIELEYSLEPLPRILYIQSFLTRDCSAPISIDSQVQARDQYATWKLAGEYLLSDYSGEHSSVVLASVISPRLTVGAIPAFARRIQNGEPIKATLTSRDYLHPSDFISALSLLLEVSNIPNQLVIGSGKSVATSDIAASIANILGKSQEVGKILESEPNPGDPREVLFDSTFFERWSGWAISYSINDAIKDCVRQLGQFHQTLRQHH